MTIGTEQACARIAAEHEAAAAMLLGRMRPARSMQQTLRGAIEAAAQIPQLDLDSMLAAVSAVTPLADATLSTDLKQLLQNDCFSGGAPEPVKRMLERALSIYDLPSPLRRQLADAAQAAASQVLAAAAATPLGTVAMALKGYEDWVKKHLGPMFDALDRAFECLAMVCGQAPYDYAADYRADLCIDESADFLTAKIGEWNASPTVQQQLSGTWAAVKIKADLIRGITF